LSGTQKLRTSVTGSNTLAVSTVVDFENNTAAGAEFTVGKMVIEADDGSKIELNADNGAHAEVIVTVASNQTNVSITEPWRTWIYDWNIQIPSPVQQLSYAQRETLPGDCLFDFDNADNVYCYSAPERYFASVSPNGTINWQFALPGDNTNNKIAGVAVIDDECACIVADLTDSVGESKFELSCFDLGGEFLSTLNILNSIPLTEESQYSGGQFAINPGGEPLLVESNGEFIYLAGSVYLMASDSDQTTGDSWERHTEFAVRIDPSNGDILAWHEFSSEDIYLSVADNGDVVLTILNEEGLADKVNRRTP